MQKDNSKIETREEELEKAELSMDPEWAESDHDEPEEASSERPMTRKRGIVTGCLKLKIRKTPALETDNTVALIDTLSEVEIDEYESTDDFYKITTATGVEGFCMKEFITVRQ